MLISVDAALASLRVSDSVNGDSLFIVVPVLCGGLCLIPVL